MHARGFFQQPVDLTRGEVMDYGKSDCWERYRTLAGNAVEFFHLDG
jgi:hypothetical protein